MFYSQNQISINKAVRQAMLKATFGKLMNKPTFAKILEYSFFPTGIKFYCKTGTIIIQN